MALHKEEERICRELGNRNGLQISLGNQALILHDRGDLEGAMALHKEKERICRELGDLAGLGVGLSNQAELLLEAGRPAEALPRIEESVALARRLGSPALAGRLELAETIRRRMEETVP
jgi:nephrocystin-3